MTAVSDPIVWVRATPDEIAAAKAWPDDDGFEAYMAAHECQVHAEVGECPHEPLWQFLHGGDWGLPPECFPPLIGFTDAKLAERVHGRRLRSPWPVMITAAVLVAYLAAVLWVVLR